MKSKYTLLFLVFVPGVLSLHAQVKRHYNNLINTEARINAIPSNYVDLTNIGTETIHLSNFEIGMVGPWSKSPFTPTATAHIMLQERQLAPGKSFVITI